MTRWIKAGLLALVGLYIAWLAVKTGGQAALADNPAQLAKVAPNLPEVAFADGMQEAMQRRAVSPATWQRVMAGLARNPLAHEPFFIGGIRARLANDDAAAARLLAEAKRRDPRSVLTRIFLLDHYIRIGDVASATGEVGVLSEVLPTEAGPVLRRQLGAFAVDPRTRPAFAAAMRSEPQLLQSVLAEMAKQGGKAEIILSLYNADPSLRRLPGNQRWQAPLLDDLVKRGEVAKAQEIWHGFAPLAAGSDGNLIYDPGFANLGAPPPFGWRLDTGAKGLAEPVRPAALQIEYYGRDSASLARQLLALPPGNYRFGFTAEGDAPGEGTRLVWSLTCTGSKSALAAIPVIGVGAAARNFTAAFAVPQGCKAQRLELRGLPGEIAQPQTALFSKLELVRSSAQ